MFQRNVLLTVIFTVVTANLPAAPDVKTKPVDVGSRLELFVDDHIVESWKGAERRLHHPQRVGPAMRFDRPWEGRFSGYVTILRDGDLLRMYYRGLPKAGADGSATESTCYAESDDGIKWRKPELGLFEVDGSKKNNVILKGFEPASHNFAPFLDSNPKAAASARFKALGGDVKGLIPFASADGTRWKRIQKAPVITKGAFDSQNVSFWSESEECYVCYFRTWSGPGTWGGYRTVSRSTSKDFTNWTEPVAMQFGNAAWDHLYTNQTHPYFRAPHIYVAVAARFWPRRRVLTPDEARAIDVDPGYFSDISDAVLMTSRGGANYDRTFQESFIRPGRGLENWVSRTNYPALGVLPTGDGELSIWVQKNYGQPTARLDRYTIRTDGFISASAGYAGGELVTKPLVFSSAPKAELDRRRAAWKKPDGRPPVEISSSKPIRGARSLRFHSPGTVRLPGTKTLGRSFTLAAWLRDVPAGHRRLFSSYDGGSTKPGELIFDYDASAAIDGGHSIRFYWNGRRVGAPFAKVGKWSDDRPHHLAVTWNAGEVAIFFDGREVAREAEKSEAEATGEVTSRRGDLLLGEDYSGTSRDNEPLLGSVDDVLVLRRALSGAQIAKLVRDGTDALDVPLAESDLLYRMEHGDGEKIESWNRDAKYATLASRIDRFPEQELILNYATSAAGSVRVEIQNVDGAPIPGYGLEDCREGIGDWIERAVEWSGSSDVSALRGKPVRLRFVVKDADLFSFRFR